MTDDDLDQLLADFRDDVPPMTDTAFLLGKVRMQARSEKVAEKPVRDLHLPVRFEYTDSDLRRSPPRRLVPWLTAAAAAAVVAGVIVVSGIRLGTSVPAEQPGDLLSWLARHTGDPVQAPGQYLLMSRHEWNVPYRAPGTHGGVVMNGGIVTMDDHNEGYWNEWVPADRTGVWQLSRDVRVSAPDPPLPGDPPVPTMVTGLSQQEGVFQAPGGSYLSTVGEWHIPNESFMASLSRDPQELDRWMSVNRPHDTYDDQSAKLEVARSLLVRPVPADLRRTLYQVLSTLRVTVNEHAATRDGRPAVSISRGNPAVEQVQTLLIDPTNGELIGTRTEFPGGQVISETTVTWSVVGGLGATS
ncbi:hypothetical protein [Actinocrispum wychmicini]|uniref:CU044_5270 family protein n=1 Tax=Actinocrispum wychmicini TaxID=1213861 RepID=A0A4R2JV63_9PSEU|nr:hypothetical protein [Actinocrispum wychmicini]TCO58035.1 hypothetical protein EV192_10597 [Actinocrispum wychmicini]